MKVELNRPGSDVGSIIQVCWTHCATSSGTSLMSLTLKRIIL